MLKNYLKIAFRSLWRTKANAIINVSGLGLGIACCLLMILFVRDEWTFDTFHSKANRIYRVYVKEDWGENQKFFNTNTPFPMGPTLKENFSEVEQEVRILKLNPQVKVGVNQYTEQLTVGGQNLFDVFDFDMAQGSRDALRKMSSVVISHAIAQKYFGQENPLNKSIAIQLGENFEDFVVTGVVNDIPTNSSIHFEILISDLNLPKLFSQQVLVSGWYNINPETYVLLKDKTNLSTLQGRFPALFKSVIGEDFSKSKYFVGLQPLTDIHLDTSFPVAFAPVSNPKYALVLAAIAGLILIVACINFITLSLGRSLQRGKEVGIRKTVGAAQHQLIFQFIGEAIIVTIISLVVGLAGAMLSLSIFNELSGKNLVLHWDLFMGSLLTGLAIVIGLIAGSYPAFVLSAFKPIAVLKGKIQGGSKQALRKTLVGVQLALSIFLVSSTMVMQKQLNYLQSRDLGFNKDQLVTVPLRVVKTGRLAERVKAGFDKVEQFKLELSKFPGIAGVCGTSHDFGNGGWTRIGYTDDGGTYRNFNLNVVDADYIKTLQMSLKAGRNFSNEGASDARRAMIVNEAFVKEYNWTDALGKRIPGKAFVDHEIIGVVKDFNFESLYTKVKPLVLVMNPAIALSGSENVDIDNSPLPKLLVKFGPGNIIQGIEHVKAAWEKINAGEEFTFSFADQTLAAQYRNDQNLGKIVSLATLLAILIGSSGLYGLASLAMQNRVKEISIRKVMGATQRSIFILLSRDYVALILICLMVSVPVTLYAMDEWLLSFEYRVDIGSRPFLWAGSISLLIGMLTVSYHVVKAAWTQPAESLKYE